MTRRLFKTLLAVIAGGVFFLLLLESMLRLLPVNSGLRMQPVNGDRPFMLAMPNQDYTYSYGWVLANPHHSRTSNLGMPNSRDWVSERPSILVVGDSFIESHMNAYAETLQGRLERAINPTPVYAMAHSGANAADYLRMMEFARSQLTLRALVFRIDGADFLESLHAEGGNVPGHNWLDSSGGTMRTGFKPYAPSPLKESLRNFALARYFQRNLKFNLVQGIRQELKTSGKGMAEGNARKERAASSAPFKPIVDYFLQQLPSRSGVALTDTVFVIDCDRKAIYGNLLMLAKGNSETDIALEYFVARAKAQGAIVVEMCPAMEAYVRRTRQRLDFSPNDYHWNPAGHAVVAEAVIPELRRILQR